MWLTIRTETRLAIRRWRTHAMVTLALAVGLAIAVTLLNLVDSLVWRPLRVPGVDRLVALESQAGHEGSWAALQLSPADIQRLESLKGPEVVAIAGVRESGAATTALTFASRTTPVRIATTTGGFFSLFGLSTLQPRTDDSGIDEVVVSEALWAHSLRPAGLSLGDIVSIEAFDPQTFGTRPRPLRITGIAPAGFHFPGDTQLWIAASASESRFRHFSLFGLVAPGIRPEALSAETITGAGDTSSGFDVRARRLSDAMVPRESWLLVLLLAVTAGLLLTVWCQTALFTTSSALAPARALETRLALGASRTRLVAELMVGPALVALVAVPMSMLLSYLLHSEVVTLLPFMAGRRADFGMYVLLWSAAAALVFLAAQALLTGYVVSRRLRDLRLGTSTPAATATPSHLAALSSCVSLVAVYVSLLLAASFYRTLNYDYGFETSGLVAIHTSAMAAGLADPVAQQSRIAAIVEHAGRVDGVTAAVRVNGLPFGTYDVAQDIHAIGGEGSPAITAKVRETEPGLFETLRVPLVKGRDFRPEETGAPVAIVTEQVAQALWPGDNPLGAPFVLGDRTYAVIGVAADFSDRAARGVAPSVSPQIFLPSATGSAILVRTEGNAAAALESILSRADGYRAFLRVTGFSYEARRDSLAMNERAYARFIGLLAWGAVLLAAVGAFATVAHTTRTALKGTAIRLGLGASRTRALLSAINTPLSWVAGGCVAGIAGGVALGELLESSIRNVKAPATEAILVSAGVTLVIVVGSVLGPARLLRRLDICVLLKENR